MFSIKSQQGKGDFIKLVSDWLSAEGALTSPANENLEIPRSHPVIDSEARQSALEAMWV